MDDFIFVPQTGHSKRNPKSRELVRAHVSRKHWQDIKAAEHSKRTQQNGPILYHNISHGSDELTYAGSSLDTDSYAFFWYYGSAFTVILCDFIQPIPIQGPGICCEQAKNSPALLHTICFFVAVCQADPPLRQNLFRDPDKAHDVEKKALYHKAMSLDHLRKVIDASNHVDAASETLILCVAILLAAEAVSGHEVGLDSHANGLARCVAIQGGLRMLSPSAARLVHFIDVKASIARGRAPLFELEARVERWPQADLPPIIRSHISGDDILLNFGLDFSDPSAHLNLCPALLLCIAKIKCVTLASLRISGHYRTIAIYDIDDFVAVEHGLLCLRRNHALSTLDECVRLALVLFMNTALWRTPIFFNWLQRPVIELKAALLHLESETALQGRIGVLLWVTLLGRYVTGMNINEECCWWSIRIRALATKTGVATFQEARQVMNGFAYVDEVYASAWEQIWNEDIARVLDRGQLKQTGKTGLL